MPQLIYYRQKAWIVASTLLRANNLSLRRVTEHSHASLCFRTKLIPNGVPPRKGRDSVKLTALSTAIPRNT